MGQYVEIDTVLRKRLRVLAKSKPFEPSRDVVRHGALLRQTGFAEAVEESFQMFRDLGRNFSGIGYRVIWLKAKILLYCGLRLIDSAHHRVDRGKLPAVGWIVRCQPNRLLG